MVNEKLCPRCNEGGKLAIVPVDVGCIEVIAQHSAEETRIRINLLVKLKDEWLIYCVAGNLHSSLI